MAAAITTTATTLEGQLMEVAAAMQLAEVAATAADEAFEQLLTIATDAEGQSITVSVTLPATVSGTAGNITFAPQTYLP